MILNSKIIIIKTITLIIIFCLLKSVSAQYDNENLKKYWYYRNRLLNYFVQVGPDAGESLVADIRNKMHKDISVGDAIFTEKLKELNHGDQTVYLGRYIAILATEYKLLTKVSQHLSC